jgi:hypothetical protein
VSFITEERKIFFTYINGLLYPRGEKKVFNVAFIDRSITQLQAMDRFTVE